MRWLSALSNFELILFIVSIWVMVASALLLLEIAEVRGLVGLGPDLIAMNRQGANFVDKIIQGSKPADLPVEQPTRYEMHVNLRTAKALGINVLLMLLARANEVIE